MNLKRRILFVFLFIFSTAVHGEKHFSEDPKGSRPVKAAPQAKMGDSLSFLFSDLRNKSASSTEERHPWLRLYEGGKDVSGKDVTATTDLLKWARGASKIRPTEDKVKGLMVILRGMTLEPKKGSKDYTVKLFGEFNGAQATISEKEMADLFSGKQVTWNIKTPVSRSTGLTRYNIETDIKLRLALEGDKLKIYSLEGAGSIEEVGFRSTTKYVSPSVSIGEANGQSAIFEGVQGELPKLNLVN